MELKTWNYRVKDLTEGEKKAMQPYLDEVGDAPTRKNLLKLIRHINMFDPVPTRHSWEYLFWNRLLTDEQVDFALTMKLRQAYTVRELAEMNHMSPEKAAEMVEELATIGLFEYDLDESGEDRVKIPVFAPGCMENVCCDNRMTDRYPEVAPAFLNYILNLQLYGPAMFPMGSALMRALPIEKAIENDTRRVKYEEMHWWLDEYEDHLAVAQCDCRKARRMVGEGTGDLEGEWCVLIGKYADSCVKAGKARRIDRAEAERILQEAEDRGYVHQVSNIDGKDFSLYLCNCSWDTCMALKTSWYTATPNLSASNYRASVDPNNCVACGGCVEVCPENAVKLGQKLCHKTPVEVKGMEDSNEVFVYTKDHYQRDLLTEKKWVVPETGTAPCKTNCPAHISVQGYLRMANEGRYREALELIKKENPFPAVCGSICARFCEQVCTRGDVDAPIAIDEVKKFLAQRELREENRFVPKKRYDKGHKIAIIGSGPAGLSCAYYLAVDGHDVTVFEKENEPGGMMLFGMPNFRLEKDIVKAEIDVIRELGVEIRCGVEVGKDITLDELRAEGYKGFYIAIGAQGGRKLGVSGEDADGVVSGIDFLRDVAFGKTKKLHGDVIVVGGGNVAVDVARTALRFGAKSVTMVSLEQRDEMPASEDEVLEAEAENINVCGGWGPKEILVKDGRVCGVDFKKCTAVLDASGKFNPRYDENDIMHVEADFVLAAIGQSIVWGDLLKGENVALGRGNTAKADAWTYQTAQEDVFVGGDVFTGPRFAIDAIAAGKEGAESLHRYVWEGHSLTLGRMRRDRFKYLDKDNMVISSYDHASRQIPQIDGSKKLTFSDERESFTEEQVRIETNRCLSCGAAQVDPVACIGCGVCTTRCNFDAIHLSKVRDAWGPDRYEDLSLISGKHMIHKAGNAIKKRVTG
ncbi:MAG: FAD-dependent oxidoreductase [Clostridia bacterium]|nr:FAD-dependent oxidoreductase [Clostridia bacterium]